MLAEHHTSPQSVEELESPHKGVETPSTLRSQLRSGEMSRSALEDIDPNSLFENFNSLVKVTMESEVMEHSAPVSRQLNYEEMLGENSPPRMISPTDSVQKPKRYRDEEAHRLTIRPFEFASEINHSQQFEKIVLESGWCREVDSDSDM